MAIALLRAFAIMRKKGIKKCLAVLLKTNHALSVSAVMGLEKFEFEVDKIYHVTILNGRWFLGIYERCTDGVKHMIGLAFDKDAGDMLDRGFSLLQCTSAKEVSKLDLPLYLGCDIINPKFEVLIKETYV